MRGKIIKGIAGFYYVYAEDGILYACKAKGIFRKDHTKPMVGDDVDMTVTHEGDKEGNITVIYDRKNSLVRPMVANVDQAMVIFAVDNPRPNFLLLDKFLIQMAYMGVPSVICFNKADLKGEEEGRALLDIYRPAGIPTVLLSLKRGEGLEEVRELLSGRTTVLAGPSGVGKSSLSNLLQPDVVMETGEVSRKLQRGKHTTRHSQLLPLGQGTFLVDTPGFSSLFLPEALSWRSLRDYYPEFAPYEDKCRFQGCQHIHEPDCAVKEALEGGAISPVRYEGYQTLHQELYDKR